MLRALLTALRGKRPCGFTRCGRPVHRYGFCREHRPLSLRELSAELGWPEPDQALFDRLVDELRTRHFDHFMSGGGRDERHTAAAFTHCRCDPRGKRFIP